jgi:hypothetical protein
VINTVKAREEILDIEFTYVNNVTYNFTVSFQNPYMYGLLNKKSDNLYFRLKDFGNDTNLDLLVMNATNQTFKTIGDSNETAKFRIGMQFDFRGKQPET